MQKKSSQKIPRECVMEGEWEMEMIRWEVIGDGITQDWLLNGTEIDLINEKPQREKFNRRKMKSLQPFF